MGHLYLIVVAALLDYSNMRNDDNHIRTVLVVDDDEDLLQIVDIKLKVEGFHTLLSLNGERVREIIAQSPPDLVLLDIHMQGISGGDICREIKSDPTTSSIPVILFSANDNVKTIQEECGADGFVTKPWEDNKLIETIYHHLHYPANH